MAQNRPPRLLSPGIGLSTLRVSVLGLGLAGYQYISIRGDSMEPTIFAGSLLLARQTVPGDVRAGDVIAFPGTSQGISNIVHRVVALQKDSQHIVALTMDDNNPVLDPEPLNLNRPVARIVLILPYLGWWMTPLIGCISWASVGCWA